MDLTTDRLIGVPKRNTTMFISEYLQGQKAFRGHFAAEGLAAADHWNGPASASIQRCGVGTTSRATRENLLETPLLKPRNAGTTITKPDPANEKAGEPESPAQFKAKATGETPSNCAQTAGLSKAPIRATVLAQKDKDKGKSKKFQEDLKKAKAKNKRLDEAALTTHSKNEYGKRLEERRDRKRAKKAIMQPPPGSDNDKENDNEDPKAKGKKTTCVKEKAPPKGHASLAFMHGFTSTSVGKHRITVEPSLRTVGVFKKGKASLASKVAEKNKKRDTADLCFSEARFLKTGSANPKRKRERSPTPSSSDDSEPILKEKGIKSPASTAKKPELESRSYITLSGSESTEDDKLARKPYNAADSIVWDIERENYVAESAVNERQSTVVVAAPRFCQPKAVETTTDDDPTGSPVATNCVSVLELDHYGDMDCMADAQDASVLSLRPSESASRVVTTKDLPSIPRANDARSIVMISKFFGGGPSAKVDRPSVPVVQPSPQIPISPAKALHQHTPDDHVAQRTTVFDRTTEPSMADDILFDNKRSVLEYPESFLWPVSAGSHPTDHEKPPLHYDEDFLADEAAVLEPSTCELSLNWTSYDQRPTSSYCLPFASDPELCYPDMDDEDVMEENGYFDFRDYDKSAFEDQADAVDEFFSIPLMTDCYYDLEEAYSTSGEDPLREESECSQLDEMYDDGASGLAVDFDRFAQGRALLYGLSNPESPSSHRVPSVEAEVAGLLRQSHWVPQRL